MQEFDLYLFDFDGTLLDTHSAIVWCVTETLTAHGLPVPERQLLHSVIAKGIGLWEVLYEVATDIPEGEISNMVETYRRFYSLGAAEKSALFPHVTETLEALRAAGRDCAVVSNKGIDALKEALAGFGILGYFSLVIGEQIGVPRKPDPTSYHTLIAKQFGTKPERTLMIGDAEPDIRYAKNCGIKSAFAAYGSGDKATCLALKPDYVLKSLKDLGWVG